MKKLIFIFATAIIFTLPLTAHASEGQVQKRVGAGGNFPQHVGCKTIVCYSQSDIASVNGTGGGGSGVGNGLGGLNDSCPEVSFSRYTNLLRQDLPKEILAQDPNDISYQDLVHLYKLGVLDPGNPDFANLNKPLTRDEMAKLYSVARTDLLRLAPCLKTTNFPDVPLGSDNYFPILNLKDKNIVHGYPDGNYRPKQTANYAETLKVTALSFGTANKDQVDSVEATQGTPWYVSYKQSLDQKSIIPAQLESLPYDAPMTQGQTYSLLDSALKKILNQ